MDQTAKNGLVDWTGELNRAKYLPRRRESQVAPQQNGHFFCLRIKG